MNKQSNTPAGTRDTGSREASGKHEGLRHPIDENQRDKQRLGEAELDDLGAATEDELRDRRSSGKPASGEPGTRRH